MKKFSVETKRVSLSEIRPNPDNPRSITKAGLDRLVKSLSDFPEMLEIREVVVDETMTVLGGNMRLRALEQAGAKQCLAKIVTGLTDEQKREFVCVKTVMHGQNRGLVAKSKTRRTTNKKAAAGFVKFGGHFRSTATFRYVGDGSIKYER